ncbi:MAG: Gfo/Idh/MocA family oxidoreductase [Deltaproteobacteria bacterium]|nr:Gfo/Idh/MocA family oxidoreductase [Deltaproteobacteria bacterium]
MRYGIIGTGMMGCEHIMNIGLTPGGRVAAISDPNETSRSWGKSFAGDGVEVYRDYRDMLRAAPIDAVVVASPNFTHYDVLQDIFRTNKHILVEKPLCTQVDHCHRTIEAGARRRGIVWVGMEYRFMPSVAHLLEQAGSQAVGYLQMIAIREHRFPFLPKVDNWNRFARNTGGTLVEKCCHFFDLMNLLAAQRPQRVFASGAQDVNHLDERYDGQTPDIIDNAFTIVDYDGGIRAMLDLCMFAEGSAHEVEITATGSRGKLQAFEPDHIFALSRRDGSDREVRTFDLDVSIGTAGAHHGSTYFEHVAFQEAIRNGTKPVVTIEDGALAVAVGAAAEQSIREHRPVELRELGF